MAPETVNLTIDGQAVNVPKGTLLIDACAQIGTYVPRFCSHPHLVPYAGCRMCLVDVEKMPKLATACSTPVGEGMVVHTATEKVRLAREGVLEFILVSHPLDCPVCDKGGECELQDQTFLYGREDSRVIDVKRFHHHFDLSSTIKLDYNRCILCKRCVRYTEEIADDDRLIFRERGAHTEISTQTDEPFNSRFGGEVIEYCPVGALTDSVFRFRARPWEIKEKPSVCNDCAMGCANTLHVRANNVVRIFSREKADLNGPYICDKGRFSHEYKDHPERVTEPLLRKNGRLEPVSWEEAIAFSAQQLTRISQNPGSHQVAAVLGAERSLEDLGAVQALLAAFDVPHVDHWPPVQTTPAQSQYFLNRLVPFQQVVDSQHLLLWDSHLFDELPMLALRLKQSRMSQVPGVWGAKNAAKVRSVSTVRTLQSRYPFIEEASLTHLAQESLLLALAEEFARKSSPSRDLQAALTQAKEALLRVDLPPADPGQVADLAEWFRADDAVLVIGQSILLQDPRRLELLELVIRLREAGRGKPLGLLLAVPAANSIGCLALGLQPRWDKRGPVGADVRGIQERIATRALRALLLVGGDHGHQWSAEAIEGLEQLECFIAAAHFLDEVTNHAHVVFPLTSQYEESGSYINAEGRLQESVRGMTPPASKVRSITEWSAEIGLRCNQTLAPRREALIAHLSRVPGLKGLHEVTAVVDSWYQPTGNDGIPTIRALVESPRPGCGPQELCLITRRPFYQPGTLLDHSPAVKELITPWAIRMHPSDGRSRNMKVGDTISLSTSAGHLTGPVAFTRGIPQGYIEVDAGHEAGRLATLGRMDQGVLAVRVDKVTSAQPEEVLTH
ncbi:MAG: Nitrate reductase [bacterium]|nr:Nitrate reductase [bacterium]